MLYFDELLQFDPDRKDATWANRLVTHFRQHWKPLVDSKKAREGMQLVMSRYNMDPVKKMFKDPNKAGMDFLSIAIMEKVRNALIGERNKAGITINVDAADPTADSQRKKDRQLLENRKQAEELFTFLNKSIGLPEYKMANDPNVPQSGDLKGFDDMGLNPADPQDVGYYFQVWHRLLHEMDAQRIINHFVNVNEVSQHLSHWVNDILAKKAIAAQSYVDEMSGQIKHNYLSPENTYIIPGDRQDGKDAQCKGYEDVVTISELMRRMGNDFDLQENLQWLLLGINNKYGVSYTGVYDAIEEKVYGNGIAGQSTVCMMSDFVNFKVALGYIEWKSWNARVDKVGVDFHGNLMRYPKGFGYQPTLDTGFKREARYEQVTYKAFYIHTGGYEQRLFKFGKLYHQAIEGAEDEYSSYSIFTQVSEGLTAAEVAHPYIMIAQEAFTKFRWMIRRAKPKGRVYNYESLVKIANKLIKEGDPKSKLSQVIAMMEEGINELVVTPTVGGERVGGGANPNMELPNGLDATAITFKEIIDWAVDKIKGDMGWNQVRDGYNPKPNDGLKLQEQTTESSMNSTDYMGEMIDRLLRNMARHNMTTIQDIVRYKDTLPYNYLVQVFGDGVVSRIQRMDAIAMHRYDIMVNSFANYNNRLRIMRDTEEAWRAKEITYDVKLLVDSIDDYRRAAYVLGFEKQRADRIKREEQQRQQAHQEKLEQIKVQGKLAEVNAVGSWDVKKEDTKGQWLYKVAQLNTDTDMKIQNARMDREGEKQDARADGNIKVAAAKQAVENQQPLL